jgi:hypothetical protein
MAAQIFQIGNHPVCPDWWLCLQSAANRSPPALVVHAAGVLKQARKQLRSRVLCGHHLIWRDFCEISRIRAEFRTLST